jgi:hypothetical protein
MTKIVRKGAVIVLAVLSIFLFFSCDTTLNEPMDSGNTVYNARAVGDTLFSIMRNGVSFVCKQTGTNQITLTMNNTQSTATVNFTVKIYTYLSVLYTSSPKSFTLYQNEVMHDYYYLPPNGGVLLDSITVTR